MLLVHDFLSDHLHEHLLEEYLLGRLAEPELDAAEEHLFVCQECRTRLTETEAFVKAIRAATRTFDSPNSLQEPSYFRRTITRYWPAEKSV